MQERSDGVIFEASDKRVVVTALDIYFSGHRSELTDLDSSVVRNRQLRDAGMLASPLREVDPLVRQAGALLSRAEVGDELPVSFNECRVVSVALSAEAERLRRVGGNIRRPYPVLSMRSRTPRLHYPDTSQHDADTRLVGGLIEDVNAILQRKGLQA